MSKATLIAQISDCHFPADARQGYRGINPFENLKTLLEKVKLLKPDLILATGDLVHDGTPAAYRRIFSHLGSFERPVYCLPGNHDEATTLQNTLREGRIKYVEHALQGNWHFIFLDSTIAHSEGAHLTQATLRTLESHLR